MVILALFKGRAIQVIDWKKCWESDELNLRQIGMISRMMAFEIGQRCLRSLQQGSRREVDLQKQASFVDGALTYRGLFICAYCSGQGQTSFAAPGIKSIRQAIGGTACAPPAYQFSAGNAHRQPRRT